MSSGAPSPELEVTQEVTYVTRVSQRRGGRGSPKSTGGRFEFQSTEPSLKRRLTSKRVWASVVALIVIGLILVSLHVRCGELNSTRLSANGKTLMHSLCGLEPRYLTCMRRHPSSGWCYQQAYPQAKLDSTVAHARIFPRVLPEKSAASVHAAIGKPNDGNWEDEHGWKVPEQHRLRTGFQQVINQQNAPHLRNRQRLRTDGKNVTIVYWTSFFGEELSSWDEECDHGIVAKITSDRSKLADAAAIIFHARGFDINDLPERAIDQKWIHDTQEAPHHDMEKGADYVTDINTMRLFDYSMSYHLGADFFHPMIVGYFPEVVLETSPVAWEDKDDAAVFIASNCESHNNREAYIVELMKHMKVASYGSCLNNRESLGRTGRPKVDLWHEQNILGRHKFYLAFENSCCVDYISEKLTSAFASGLIPVVAGPEDYSSYAPANRSIINIRDFASPKHLAQYLNKVAQDKDLYDSYMAYKSTKTFSRKFETIWRKRTTNTVYCDIAEEMISYRSKSNRQSGHGVLPLDPDECEPKDFLKTTFVMGQKRRGTAGGPGLAGL